MAAADVGTDGWEIVVGLEVHVQLLTASKLFSPAPTAPQPGPDMHNTAVDVVDLNVARVSDALGMSIAALMAAAEL